MVSHDVLRDCAHHALTEWQHAEYKGNWHPLPAAEDVWEGRWLTGFHFQVACPGGGVSNCHPFFVKVNASLPKGMFVDNKAPECSWSTSKRYAVEVAKELRRRGTPVVGVWLVTKNGRKLVYGSAQSKQFPNHLPFKIVGQPDIRCPVTTPEGVGDCFYPITTHDPSVNWFSSHCVTRDEKKVPQLIEAMALAGVPLAGILRVTEHGQRIDFRSDTVPVMGVVQPAVYKEEFGTW